MRTLILLTAIVLAQSETDLPDNPPFKVELDRQEGARTNFNIVDYKGEPNIQCTADELCDAEADLSNWRHVQDSDHYNGEWEVRDHPWIRGKKQLVMKDEMKYYGLSRPLTLWDPAASDKPLAFSMTARFGENHNCGGAYVKLYNRKDDQTHDLDGKKPYSIMFGPDRCGISTRKIHFIAQYTDTTGERMEEHLATNIDLPTDITKSHQYAFSLTPKNGGYLQVLVDGQVVQEGDLKTLTKHGWKSTETIDDPADVEPEDWKPPARMIPDPDAVKPEDWDDDEPETIEDVNAEMPEDWLEDEPELIPNESAVKPEGWDDEEDGEWVRPMMKNPKCVGGSGCGTWTRPMIPNPLYKGPWEPPMIANPEYTDKYPTRQIPHPKPYDISEPFKTIEPFNTLGIEIWTVQAGTTLDNFMVSTDPAKMKEWSKEAFAQIQEVEEENYKVVESKKAQNETVDSMIKNQDPKRYLKIGAAAIIIFTVLFVAVRKLFGTHFRASDSPQVPETTPEKENVKKTAPKEATLESSETTSAAQDTKKSEEIDTEPSAGETKPTLRPGA